MATFPKAAPSPTLRRRRRSLIKFRSKPKSESEDRQMKSNGKTQSDAASIAPQNAGACSENLLN